MILEHAILNVRPGQGPAFEQALTEALPLISATPGFIDLEVRPCLEAEGRYLLLVRWRRLEDHTVGFRGSDRLTASTSSLRASHFWRCSQEKARR